MDRRIDFQSIQLLQAKSPRETEKPVVSHWKLMVSPFSLVRSVRDDVALMQHTGIYGRLGRVPVLQIPSTIRIL